MAYKMNNEEVPIVAPKGVFKKAQKTFTPLYQGVCVQVLPETMTAGGLHIPESAVRKGEYITPRGIVIAIGPDVKMLKEGDEVILGNAPMAMISLKGQPELLVVAEPNLVGVRGVSFERQSSIADGVEVVTYQRTEEKSE